MERNRTLSRRSFVRIATGVATAGLMPESYAQRSASVPPSIAALQPMTGLVPPFTHAEREARIEKARRLMAAEKIAAVVLMGGSSPQYFANVTLGGGERLWALVIPSNCGLAK